MHIRIIVLVVVLLVLAFGVGRLSAAAPSAPGGNMDSPGPPGSTSSYTLEDIYDRLDTGAAGTQSAFTEPAAGPTAGTGHTLNEIMALAPAIDGTNGATQTDVLTGQTFWGLTSGGWGPLGGTMPDNGAVVMTPTTANQQPIAAGYHNGAGYVVGDADLVAGSIAQGVDLFGVAGVCGGIPATGQTTSYGAGDDGAYQLGCRPAVSPPPSTFHRGFTDNGDGTITDNLTGLIWLKDAGCIGTRSWPQALSAANGLASGSCGLSDGSSAGDWRLPNVNEMRSLIDPSQAGPALPAGHPFANVQSSDYWSSTTHSTSTTLAWGVHVGVGLMNPFLKTSTPWVWPVRGGQ
jgi:hypothetical protein